MKPRLPRARVGRSTEGLGEAEQAGRGPRARFAGPTDPARADARRDRHEDKPPAVSRPLPGLDHRHRAARIGGSDKHHLRGGDGYTAQSRWCPTAFRSRRAVVVDGVSRGRTGEEQEDADRRKRNQPRCRDARSVVLARKLQHRLAWSGLTVIALIRSATCVHWVADSHVSARVCRAARRSFPKCPLRWGSGRHST